MESFPGQEALSQPFLEFAPNTQPQTPLRAKIAAAYRRPEPECVPALMAEAALPGHLTQPVQNLARQLVLALRAKQAHGGVEALIHEFSLSSQEGVALMCLAEALLRIPDLSTRDALIRDKIGHGDWRSHLGHSKSLFVNAAVWGLLITGRLIATASETGLSTALARLIAKGGEPLIRKSVDLAMRLLGEQFVTGRTIEEALAKSRAGEARGFLYSYDMLGEAALTAEDAARYYENYEAAIHAIGQAAGGRGIYGGPGISIKLSALHPRYARAQRPRIMSELLPRLKQLALLVKRYDIGLNIDAEEADRLDLSLDLLERLCFDPDFTGWNGIGFVVQAYQKRAPFVVDYLIDLAHRSNHRLMIRLVKGAYWDSEIKRAQLDGLEGFAVYTRKTYTDLCYIACARRLLAAPDAAFPQFATHNAQTLAAIYHLAGEKYYPGQYEFQCLHGMGEALYEEVVGPDKLGRPCRIYGPVGTHETLLAYLVRRLLENGANTSFVNRLADTAISIEELIADPAEAAAAVMPPCSPHPRIALPAELFGDERRNSAGLDLSNEQVLAALSATLTVSTKTSYRACPVLADGERDGTVREIRNPADRRDLVGTVMETSDDQIDEALAFALDGARDWGAAEPGHRAAILLRAANLMQARMPALLGLIVREAGRTVPNAMGEVREAIDYLRYYATEIRRHFSKDSHRPLGPVLCISPWNFPLAIFTGQIAAALAAGNAVLAKPAEETPLIAAETVRILHEAGVPPAALQLLPGEGAVAARLVADRRVRGVVFTGSTEVAKIIERSLAQRPDYHERPIPLIAETGGQNALIADSSALPEQLVADVLISAFDSAGQRCSALRVLCLQEESAGKILTMLKGAMRELRIGNPRRLATDIGPVISAETRQNILDHVAAMRRAGRNIVELSLPEEAHHGTFVAPTLIEMESLAALKREVFGPVLHVLRYRREELDALIDEINATGYGLTFGIHSRIDETIAHVSERIAAGNIYVNRSMIGAAVGVQPFGGHGMSGTGPKAGGPLYLRRLLATCPADIPLPQSLPDSIRTVTQLWCDWLNENGHSEAASRCAAYLRLSRAGTEIELAGPVGERNLYWLEPRGTVLCLAQSAFGLYLQIGAALATGNRAMVAAGPQAAAALERLPDTLAAHISITEEWPQAAFDAALFEGRGDRLCQASQILAARQGPIISIQGIGEATAGTEDYALELLLRERSLSINTAAAGGNASLMTIG